MKIKTPTARVTSYSYSSYLRLVCVCLYVFNIIGIILIRHSSRSSSNPIATLGIDNQKDTLSKMLHNGRECVSTIYYKIRQHVFRKRVYSAKIVSRLIFSSFYAFTVFICSPHRITRVSDDFYRFNFKFGSEFL